MRPYDGGPVQGGTVTELRRVFTGVTIRDWFAGQAMAASFRLGTTAIAEIYEANLAAQCYKLADAMLAERMKETP